MPSIPNIDIDPPKYGPPNMAEQLYKMISGIPQAYQEGAEGAFKRGQYKRTEELQKPILGEDGHPETDPMKISAELARRDPTRALEYPGQAITLQEQLNWLKRHPAGGGGAPQGFPTSQNEDPDNIDGLIGGTGGRAPTTLAKLTAGKFSDQPQAAASLATMFGITPDQPLTPKQEAAVRRYVLQDADNGPDETASAGPSGAAAPGPGLDPRTSAPPNMQPGVMGGPPSVAPGSPGFTPYAPGGGPPGAVPPQQVAQAGLPQAGPPQSYAAPLQPFIPPATQPTAGGTPAVPSQSAINEMRNRAQRIRDDARGAPGPAAAQAEKAAQQWEKAAEQAQKTRDAVAEKTDPAILRKDTDQAIEKGNIAAGQKEAGRLQTAANTARRGNQQLGVMRTTMADPNFYSGAGHEAVQQYREWLAGLPGGNPNAAAPMQEFHKTTMEMLNQRIQNAVEGGYSRIQLREIENMQKQIASLGVSPATNRYIMEELSRIHLMDMKLNDFANKYIGSHGYLDRNWPQVREEFMSRPENRLFTDDEMNHPSSIAPSYYPASFKGDVTKTKAFIRQQGLKDSDPVAVDDYSKPPGPDGVRPRKLLPASEILRLTVGPKQ